jgi:hypothetical protein
MHKDLDRRQLFLCTSKHDLPSSIDRILHFSFEIVPAQAPLHSVHYTTQRKMGHLKLTLDLKYLKQEQTQLRKESLLNKHVHGYSLSLNILRVRGKYFD